MAVYDFAANIGGAISFVPTNNDVLHFSSGYRAAGLRFFVDGLDLLVFNEGNFVRLVGVDFATLTNASFDFDNGSVVRLDSAAADTLTGTALEDYFDLRKGGDDTVTADAGADTIYAGAALDAADQVAGGSQSVPGAAEIDTLIVSGVYAGPVVFNANTVTGIEAIEVQQGTKASFTLHNNTVASAAGALLTVNAAQLSETDSLTLDASAVTGGTLNVTGGAGKDVISGGSGADTLAGGDGQDTINGGGGNDVISGGLDGDTLDGQGGDDRFTFSLALPRSDSSPAEAGTIDTIKNFEGAGVTGGDVIDLPSFAALLPLAFNDNPADLNDPHHYSFTFTTLGADGVQMNENWIGDGFADVLWQYNSAQARVEVWVDANDDGQFSEGDILIYLTGISTLSQGDFVDNFPAWRGYDDKNDTWTFNNLDNIGYALGGNDTLFGADGNDTLHGGADDDTLHGEGDNDTLLGEAGNDTLNGGVGSDQILGGSGNDILNGGDNDDSLYADDYNHVDADDIGATNTLNGDAGNDQLSGAAGKDTLNGGANDDALYGGGNDDILNGDANNDTLYGDDGHDTLNGGTGNDTLFGGSAYYTPDGDDELDGGEGSDLLIGLAGKDILTGGAGASADTFGFWAGDSSFAAPDVIKDFHQTDGDKIALFTDVNSSGIANGRFGPENKPLAFHAQKLPAGFSYADGLAFPGYSDLGSGFAQVWWGHVDAGGGATKTVVIVDTNDDSELSGGDFVIELDGAINLTASDFVSGQFAVLIGTPGVDTAPSTILPTGAGDDIVYGVGGNDNLSGLAGNDELHGGNNNDTLNGNDDNDILFGEAHNDTLTGGTGFDQLFGGSGNDTLSGGDNDDTLYADGAGGTDVASATNTLNGDAGNDQLYGALGKDTLNGGGDDDYLYGGLNDDVLNGDAGKDLLQGDDGNDTLNGGDGDDTLSGGSAYYLSDGNDIIDGGNGSDLLIGHFGKDTLTGGAGAYADTFGFWASDSSFAAPDTITDFHQADADKLALFADVSSSGIIDGTFASKPLVFHGTQLTGDFYKDGFALPGYSDLEAGFVQVWWGQVTVGLATKTVVIADTDDDGVLTGNDFVVELTGAVALKAGDFADGQFKVLVGTPNADTAPSATLPTGAGDDIVYGLAGNDNISGLAGDDELHGGNNNDTLNGNDDNDILYGEAHNDTLNGGAGFDQLYGGAGNDTLSGGDDADTLYSDGAGGTDAASATNTLNGDAGNDQLVGAEGIDTLNGGDDDDYLYGKNNDDILDGGKGADFLQGDNGSDKLNGGADDDTIVGGSGAYLDDGNDIIDGGTGADLLIGHLGKDTLTGGAGVYADTFGFWAGDSSLAGPDTITDFHQADGDRIALYTDISGSGFINGTFGQGSRPLVFRGQLPTGFTFTNGTALTDYSKVGPGFTQVWWGQVDLGGGARKTILVADTDDNGVLTDSDFVLELTGAVNLTKGDFATNTFKALVGTSANDTSSTLPGTAGNDWMFGVGGNDSMSGAGGNDEMYGGTGNDSMTGSSGDDVVYGESGNDTLSGSNGTDQLFGGSGSDTLNGGNDADTLYAGDRFDAGAEAASTINTLNGDAGDDQLVGAAGKDTLNGGADNDTLSGGGNADTLSGDDGNDYLVGGDGNDIVKGGAGEDTLAGGSSAYLADGNDILDGGTGADLLIGHLGKDTLTGGDGVYADTFGFWAGDSSLAAPDTITDFHQADGDRIALYTDISGSGFINGTFGPGNRPLVFRGQLPTGFTFTDGAALADYSKVGPGFTQVWWGQVDLGGGAKKTILVADTDDNGVLTGSDFVLELNGAVNLTASDFASGTFRALVGTSANDNSTTLPGTAGNDWMFGVGGNDSLSGAGGNDEMYGGIGNDSMTGSTGDDVVYGESGNDTLSGSNGTDQLYGGSGDDTLSGGNDADTLYADDPFHSDFDDPTAINTLNGDAGSDTLYGGAGKDTLNGGADNDTLSGGANDDILSGGTGVDQLFGGDGDDVLSGGTLGDDLDGGNGSDTADYSASAGVDVSLDGSLVATGEALSDTFSSVENLTGSSVGADNLAGDDGGNVLRGLGGADSLFGRGGNDLLVGGAGKDTLDGGTGVDTADYSDKTDAVVVVLKGSLDASAVVGGVAEDTLREIENLIGGSAGDTLTGDDNANRLDGGAGADTLAGGLGDDIYVVDVAGDVVTEATGAGSDTVLAKASYTLASGSEIEFLEAAAADGTAAMDLTGNAFAQTITGNAGNNVIKGGGGLDTMRGLGGNDTYVVDSADDIVVEGSGQGTADVVSTSVTYALGAAAQVETLRTTSNAGTTAINLTGNKFAQTIIGNAGANLIKGGGGLDTLQGLGGDDTYVVDSADDIVVEGSGQGTADIVTTSVSYTLGAAVQVETLRTTSNGGTTAIDLTGNSFAQTIVGNAGDNLINGGGGLDTLQGLGGNDIYIVDSADDIVVEGSGQGTADVVKASVSYVLGAAAQVEALATTSSAGTGALDLTGNGFAQTITGNAGANLINGGGGADTLQGLGGNDTYVVDSADDIVVEEAGQGTADVVMTSVSYTLDAAAQVETLKTTNSALTTAIALTGNGFAQTIIGNAGSNVIDGGGGLDVLQGLGGNDTYHVDSANDVVVEAGGEGTADVVLASVTYSLAAAAEVETLKVKDSGDFSSVNLTGNLFNQFIVGSAGANVLKGGGGLDTLQGLEGDDIYYVDSADDIVVEASGQGAADLVTTNVSYALAAGAEIETLRTTSNAGTSAINLTGNAFAQQIIGNAGDNVLHDGGVGGTDTLIGLGGNDTYRVYNALDVIVESASQGTADRVMTAVDYALGSGVFIELFTTNGSTGTSGIDLTGNDIAQQIVGNAGANIIDGKGGNDTLQGLGGKDTFAFTSTLGAANVDTITDFNVVDDRFLLSQSVFAVLNTGTLAAAAFRANTTGLAQASSDRIVYETDTGKVFYDVDGVGGASGIHFATVAVGLALTNADFLVA
jgi:Ca2+-binding RTX toxin-like protein